jgi:Tol biopolymer transport system component/tRNA A-37 threonylcarbamoyl transferase component Bud32
MIGQAVSHYRILEPLGHGGMGVVYKARDERLDRFVAIKVLRPDLTREDEARRRFLHEARAASALEHTNICTIYEVDETADGQLFLAMAYYDGESLKTRIARGPLSVGDALDTAIQIGTGLGVAHASGIVHRDIKPANVMMTRHGDVKVVDFGLAKLMRQTALTRTGTTLGTVAYMSPEQAQGQECDHRTDVWSLGVVLYEMLTGQVPFGGDQPYSIWAAIIHNEPRPLTSLRSGLPVELERVLARALAKRPDERYQSAGDFVAELRTIARSATGRTTAAPAVPAPAGRRFPRPRAAWIVGILIVLAASVSSWPALWGPSAPLVPRLSRAVQVTSFAGVEDSPAWSPEGGRLAYASSQSGNDDIWVTQVSGGAPVNRTADNVGRDGSPSWAPDGQSLAFLSFRAQPGLYVVPAVGGNGRLIKTVPGPRVGAPRWSPDGTELAYLVQDAGGDAIEITSVITGASRRLPLRCLEGCHELSWSPDGRFFAYVDSTDAFLADVTQIKVMQVSDRSIVPATDGRWRDVSPTWSVDGSVLFFVSNRGGSMDLWQQALRADGAPFGDAQPLTAGVGMRRVAFSADGRKVAYSKGGRISNIWRVPVFPDRAATWADATQITLDEAHIEHLDVSPDGRRLVVSSNRSGNPDLWLLPAAGGDMERLTVDPTPDWCPRWSPDGKEILFYAYRSGHRNLWVVPSDGGPARSVTNTEATDWYPSWSPDGRWIVFESNRSGGREAWIVPAAGGDPRQVTTGAGSAPPRPEWLDAGRLIFSRADRWWGVPASGGRPEALFSGRVPGGHRRLSPDRQTLYFSRGGQHWGLSVRDGRERPVTALSGRAGRLDTAIATDGRYLYFGWAEDRGDLWVMDVGR